ncbi:MAG: lipoyl(octanoyl) transferase [Epsilonproteobacteria bacterium]|nr:lipoyl(octanoyl) transferase [Campylobacterota bacterium]
MEILDLGKIEYGEFLKLQKALTPLKKNYLLFATHNPVYTVGESQKELFPFALSVKRGGSITYFDEGTLMVYFIFNVNSPVVFFKNLRRVFDSFFASLSSEIYYDKTRPGYYIENRKIASIGLNYTNNRSNHGVSIHLNPDLDKFNAINPCNLSDIKATSLYNEKIFITKEEMICHLTPMIKDIFETKS